MNNKISYSINKDADSFSALCKSRAISPLFLEGGEIKRILIDKEKSKPKEYRIKFEK